MRRQGRAAAAGRGRQRLFDGRARRARAAHYRCLRGLPAARVLRRPLAGVYLSFFLMMTLMILVGATWMGLYLAKRITEPVQRLATAAREIEAGHLDYRVDRGDGERRRVRIARRGVQQHGERGGEEPQAARTLGCRSGAEARRGRGAPPLHRDNSRAHRYRRRVDRRGGRVSTLNSAADAAARSRSLGRRPAGDGRVRARRSPAIRRPAARGGDREGRAFGPGDCVDARRPRAAARRHGHGAARQRRHRRHGAGASTTSRR